MFYCLKSEYKKLLWFIFGLFCGLLINHYDFKNLLLEDTYAIGPTNWYNSKQMNLYSSLIVNSSNSTIDNGTNVVSDNIPMISFNQITASNLDLMFAPTLVVKDYSYQLNVYSCGMSALSNNLRTGAENTNMSTASNLYHSTSWVSNPTTSYSGPSGCKIDTFVFTSQQTGVYFKIGISNNSTYSNFRILGYTLENVSKGSGVTTNDLLSTQNAIISNVNSNNNNVIHGALSDLETNITSNNNSNFNEVNSNLSDLNSNVSSDYFTPNTGNDFFDSDSLSGQEDLLSLVELPIEFLQNIANSTCTPMSFNFRYGTHTQNITFPCMSSTYRTYAGDFFTIYQTITTGLICYYCIMSMIHTTTKVLDPEKAHLETVDL